MLNPDTGKRERQGVWVQGIDEEARRMMRKYRRMMRDLRRRNIDRLAALSKPERRDLVRRWLKWIQDGSMSREGLDMVEALIMEGFASLRKRSRGRTVEAVKRMAAKHGVSERTVYRYLKDAPKLRPGMNLRDPCVFEGLKKKNRAKCANLRR